MQRIIILLFLISSPLYSNDVLFESEFAFSSYKYKKGPIVEDDPLAFLNDTPDMPTWLDATNDADFMHAMDTRFDLLDQMEEICRKNNWPCYELTDWEETDTVSLSDDLHFSIDVEQPKVVRIHIKSASLEDLKKNEKMFEDLIFGATKKIGLNPVEAFGWGDISILDESFSNTKTLQKFIKDYHNHPGVGFGFYEKNRLTSLPFQLLDSETQNKLEKILDSDKYSGSDGLEKFLEDYNKVVNRSGVKKNDATEIHSILVRDKIFRNGKRIEMRGHQSQQSMAQFIDQCEVYNDRIKHVQSLDDVKIKKNRLPLNYEEAFKQAREYFKTSTVNIDKYWKQYYLKNSKLLSGDSNFLKAIRLKVCNIFLGKLSSN